MNRAYLFFCALALSGACGSDNSPPATEPPVISRVAWTHLDPNCTQGSPSDVEVVVTATDADTATAALAFSGSVSGCTGSLDMATSTITCPQVRPYTSSVMVMDPENNMDTQGFSISPCVDGEVVP